MTPVLPLPPEPRHPIRALAPGCLETGRLGLTLGKKDRDGDHDDALVRGSRRCRRALCPVIYYIGITRTRAPNQHSTTLFFPTPSLSLPCRSVFHSPGLVYSYTSLVCVSWLSQSFYSFLSYGRRQLSPPQFLPRSTSDTLHNACPTIFVSPPRWPCFRLPHGRQASIHNNCCGSSDPQRNPCGEHWRRERQRQRRCRWRRPARGHPGHHARLQHVLQRRVPRRVPDRRASGALHLQGMLRPGKGRMCRHHCPHGPGKR